LICLGYLLSDSRAPKTPKEEPAYKKMAQKRKSRHRHNLLHSLRKILKDGRLRSLKSLLKIGDRPRLFFLRQRWTSIT
jgi:hypothetical protein